MIIFQKHVHVFKYAMQSLIWYILIFLNLTKRDRRQNEKKNLFPQCFVHCQYCIFDAIYLEKKSQLLFSILNNYNIYKLFRITNSQTHTHTHRHTQVHIFLSLVYTECWLEAMNPFGAHDQKRETHFPSSHLPS